MTPDMAALAAEIAKLGGIESQEMQSAALGVQASAENFATATERLFTGQEVANILGATAADYRQIAKAMK